MDGMNTTRSFTWEEFSKIGSSEVLARIRVLDLLQHPVKSIGRVTSNFERSTELLLLTNYQLLLVWKKPHTWQYLLEVTFQWFLKNRIRNKRNGEGIKKEVCLFINIMKSL